MKQLLYVLAVIIAVCTTLHLAYIVMFTFYTPNKIENLIGSISIFITLACYDSCNN